MKRFPRIVAALAVSAACLPAFAADVSQTQTLDLSGGGITNFYHLFSAATSGDTFTDIYNFSAVSGATLSTTLTAFDFGGLSAGATLDSVSVYNSAGFSLAASPSGTGAVTWAVDTTSLATDSYYLRVVGTVNSDIPGVGYFGSISAPAPVPEPATYGMMLAGVGMLGMLARRRRKQ